MISAKLFFLSISPFFFVTLHINIRIMKIAEYITKIEILSLWQGRKHIVWEPRRDVNVLSGKNGAGKSTILNHLVNHLRQVPSSGEITNDAPQRGVKISFFPEDATAIRYDIIRSFDRKFAQSETLDALRTEAKIATELDWQLYQLNAVTWTIR